MQVMDKKGTTNNLKRKDDVCKLKVKEEGNKLAMHMSEFSPCKLHAFWA